MQAQSRPSSQSIQPLPPPPPPIPGNLTAQELREVRKVYSDQLINIMDRRGRIVDQLRRSTGAERVGLEQHLTALDQRILRLENDLERTSQMLANAVVANPETFTGVAPQPPFQNFGSGQMTGIAIVFTVVVLMPIAISIARVIWRRATQPKQQAPAWDAGQRLDRMEHAIDAIAVEVERISEGQRFVTKLLTESPNFGALNSGQKVAEPVAQKEAVKVPREER